MGTFGGHALPGSFFIFFSLWWAVQAYRRYFRSLRKGGTPFQATPTYPCDCLCGRARYWQWEGILKVFFTTVGFTLEIITAFKDGHFEHLGNGQHATMFFFFGVSGVIDLIVAASPTLLPKGIEYMIGTLAFSVEALLFAFHTHGRTMMDQLIHTLLLYAICACVALCIVELRYRHNVLVPLARAYAVLLQGTWFWQAGFILYNPNPHAEKWNPENHEQMMIITMMYAWHMAAAFLVLLLLGLTVRLVERWCCLETPDGSSVLANGGRHYDRIKLVSSTRGEGGGEDVKRNAGGADCEDGSGGEGSGDETMFERVGGVASRVAVGDEI